MRSIGLCACVLAAVATGCGGDAGEAPSGERRDPFVALEEEFERGEREELAAPRWERLAVLEGNGSRTSPVTVAAEAIQWRLRWTCEAGAYRVAISPPPAGFRPFEGSCPDRRTESVIGTGERRMEIEAAGSWRAVVEQQVQTQLREPPLPGMSAPDARVVARGRFRSVERPSRGEAVVHRLASGRLALRLEGFRTAANTDLFVWLSRAARPRTTRQALAAPRRVLGALKSTLGDQNYLLPPSVGLGDVRSIVIWCEPIRIAYAAAPLRRSPASSGSRGSATNSS